MTVCLVFHRSDCVGEKSLWRVFDSSYSAERATREHDERYPSLEMRWVYEMHEVWTR